MRESEVGGREGGEEGVEGTEVMEGEKRLKLVEKCGVTSKIAITIRKTSVSHQVKEQVNGLSGFGCVFVSLTLLRQGHDPRGRELNTRTHTHTQRHRNILVHPGTQIIIALSSVLYIALK